jgi:hypothetical protein
MKTEITKFVEFTAKKFLDGILYEGHKMEVFEDLDGAEIFSSLKDGQTKNLLFNNLEQFNTELNQVMKTRINYLLAEGFLIVEDKQFRALTEEELEEFITVE